MEQSEQQRTVRKERRTESKRKKIMAAARDEGQRAAEQTIVKYTGIKTQIQEAILDAATLLGEDGKGRNGLTGYLKDLARNEKRLFCRLLEKLIPTQITGKDGDPLIPREFNSVEDVANALRDRGLPVPSNLTGYKQ